MSARPAPTHTALLEKPEGTFPSILLRPVLQVGQGLRLVAQYYLPYTIILHRSEIENFQYSVTTIRILQRRLITHHLRLAVDLRKI